MDGKAAKVAASESGDERVQSLIIASSPRYSQKSEIFRFAQHDKMRDVASTLQRLNPSTLAQ
jgi:hypothetical protein